MASAIALFPKWSWKQNSPTYVRTRILQNQSITKVGKDLWLSSR